MAAQKEPPLDFPVTWEEMHRNARALAWQLQHKRSTPWKGVIGIARGGLVPATVIARELDLRMVETLCMASYNHKSQGKIKTLKVPTIADKGKGWIVIDDLVDTGGTFREARKLLPHAHFAAVYAKPKGMETVDSFVTTVSQNTWIHFPWDLDIQPRYSDPIASALQKKGKSR